MTGIVSFSGRDLELFVYVLHLGPWNEVEFMTCMLRPAFQVWLPVKFVAPFTPCV
jgi:hypothetical protein